MAIEKNNLEVSRFDLDLTVGSRSRKSMSSDDDELHGRSPMDSEDSDEFEDADSGAGSDDFDLRDVGEENGSEICQVGDQTCCIPVELYDLPDLSEILSVDVWNECLSEEERFSLTKYLPDMEQETYMHTLKELLQGTNFNFGSPVTKLFQMLKGGLCDPRVTLYRQGLNFFQRRQHYHMVRNHQNSMVSYLLQTREAWKNCKGYSIDEKLGVLNIVRSRKSLPGEQMDFMLTDSSGLEESVEKAGYGGVRRTMNPSPDYLSRGRSSSVRTSFEPGKKRKYVKPAYEDPISRKVLSKVNHAPMLDTWHRFSSKKTKREMELLDPSFGYDEWDIGGRKSKLGKGFSDANLKTARISQKQMEYRLFRSQKQLMENTRGISAKERGPITASCRNGRVFRRDDDTESDSSDQLDEEEDDNPLMISKLTFPGDALQSSRSSVPRYGLYHENDKKAKKGRKQSAQTIDEVPRTRRIMGDFQGHLRLSDTGNYTSKSRQKAKIQQVDHFESSISQVMEANCYNGLKRSKIDRNERASKKDSKNGQIRAAAEWNSPLPLKGTVGKDFSPVKSNCLDEYFAEEDGDSVESEKIGGSAACAAVDRVSLIGCTSIEMRRKAKDGFADVDAQEFSDYMDSMSKHLLDEPPPARKRVKNKVEGDTRALNLEITLTEVPVTKMEPEPKPPKKFTLITPTIHTDFSFSIVHLLSAVRVAMITPKPEVASKAGKLPESENTSNPQEIMDDENGKHQCLNGSNGNSEVINSECSGKMKIMPLLSVQEIVSWVRSNPGDPCILDIQEPLDDLIRGILKIFSSRTAPLGAKGWKPLAYYEKSRKSWSWTGPMPQSSSDDNASEIFVSPEAWGVPHKMLVKLVDSFAAWLKSSQETLRQIGSLPIPPLELMQVNLDEKERFRDMRAQKSLATINPSCEEVRGYFRKEEHLRYLVPDRAFSYTAADGKKSIVAPLRRGGGKPTSKARDHSMLKRDRPPHVTILCLVRDAAARLPGGIGTRADVCTMIRDSQYIVEETTDLQVHQVVSGALDRLHYERDPCVQFDSDKKLWVYLHREREEEDFEDDGTSSTKKWKRPTKDATEQCEQKTSTVTKEQDSFVSSSGLNAELSHTGVDEKKEILNTVMLNSLVIDDMSANELLCHEISVNEEVNDLQTFAG